VIDEAVTAAVQQNFIFSI